MTDYTELFLCIAVASLGLAYVVWHRALAARERANAIARDACSRAVVQFLDDTVAFAGFRVRRHLSNRWRLLRVYVFDYTANGTDRAQGFVVLAGLELQSVGLAGAVPS